MTAREQQRFDEAKRRAADLANLIYCLGPASTYPRWPVDAENIQAAALGPLSPVHLKAVANLVNQALENMDAVAGILSGLCPDDMALFFANLEGWRIELAKSPEQLRAQTRAFRAQRKAMGGVDPAVSSGPCTSRRD